MEFIEIVFQALLVDMCLYLVSMVVLAISSHKYGWGPRQQQKISFWLTLQLLVLMGFALSLLSPWPLLVFSIFMIFSISMLVLGFRVADWLTHNMEEAFGPEYWKKPGTRGKLFPFLYRDKFKRLMYYNQRLEKNANDIEAWTEKGKLLKELGEEQEALACYARADGLRRT